MDAMALKKTADTAAEMAANAREMLVKAVRDAAKQGMSQRAIANTIGKSQPEVNRLIRFHGSSPAGLQLRKVRDQVIDELDRAGMKNPRVFGSVSRGEDHEKSDIDLLVTNTKLTDLMEIVRVQYKISDIIGREVDLVFDDEIKPVIAQQIMESAVPL